MIEGIGLMVRFLLAGLVFLVVVFLVLCLVLGIISFVYETPKQLKRIADALEKRGETHDN